MLVFRSDGNIYRPRSRHGVKEMHVMIKPELDWMMPHQGSITHWPV